MLTPRIVHWRSCRTSPARYWIRTCSAHSARSYRSAAHSSAQFKAAMKEAYGMETSVDELVEVAREAQSAGRWDDALAAYERALTQTRQVGAENAELLRRIGQVHSQRGEFKLAEDLYDASIAAARSSGNLQHMASALNSQANCQRELGRLDRSEQLFIAAQRLA